ncbi:DUF397 domain-containing protein [Streptomyces sp. JJ66]|uniref:DUF397 domain-containing protein n=1 Tax=Streptomyces sp. JJ66 TaxID=2803843 RepID=UPI001C58EFCE|nr:DUF397 domain-containing protein [Streptomyces sp. JJ66]MBW1604619.1 DUF397 domain-containing protein [Streptomyces sp. JJ66]
MNDCGWQKSSYCAEGNNCVEMRAGDGEVVALRESTEADRVLRLSRPMLHTLLTSVREGRLAELSG